MNSLWVFSGEQALMRARSVIRMRDIFLGGRKTAVSGGFYLGNSINRRNYEESRGSGSRVSIGELIRRHENNGEFYYSLELVSREGAEDIYKRKSTNESSPLFFTLTNHVKSSSGSLLPLQLLPKFPKNTLLHLPSRGLKRVDAEEILENILNLGMMNLLVIRGDNPVIDCDFPYASDLIDFIKKKYGSRFSIGVAGYPDTHPESPSRAHDLHHLRKKVDAGADFIISQSTFESQPFIKFVNDCRSIGIDAPIIPGLFPITTYKSLIDLKERCSLKVPEKVHNDVFEMRNEEARVQEYGINLTVEIINDILDSGIVHGFHLFTLNNLSTFRKIISAVVSARRINHRWL